MRRRTIGGLGSNRDRPVATCCSKYVIPKETIEYRTELHKLAELSGQEIKTAQYIQNKLEEMGFNVRSGVGGHGLVVDIDSGVAGPMVMLRADIDALPYADPNDPERIEAIHACGHDAHAAILLAAAPEIRKNA